MRHENMRSTKSGEDGISDAIRKKEMFLEVFKGGDLYDENNDEARTIS